MGTDDEQETTRIPDEQASDAPSAPADVPRRGSRFGAGTSRGMLAVVVGLALALVFVGGIALGRHDDGGRDRPGDGRGPHGQGPRGMFGGGGQMHERPRGMQGGPREMGGGRMGGGGGRHGGVMGVVTTATGTELQLDALGRRADGEVTVTIEDDTEVDTRTPNGTDDAAPEDIAVGDVVMVRGADDDASGPDEDDGAADTIVAARIVIVHDASE